MRRHRIATLAILVLGAAASAHAGLAKGGDTTTILKATLSGRYLHTTSTGAGTATIMITPSQVCWKFSFHGIAKPGVSGIHVAPPAPHGEHTPSVLPFTATTSETRQCETADKVGRRERPEVDRENRCQPRALLRHRRRRQGVPGRRHRRRPQCWLTSAAGRAAAAG